MEPELLLENYVLDVLATDLDFLAVTECLLRNINKLLDGGENMPQVCCGKPLKSFQKRKSRQCNKTDE